MIDAASPPGITRWTRSMVLVNAGLAGIALALVVVGNFLAWILVAITALASIDAWLASIDEVHARPVGRFHRLMWLVPASLLLPGLVITIALGFLELVR